MAALPQYYLETDLWDGGTRTYGTTREVGHDYEHLCLEGYDNGHQWNELLIELIEYSYQQGASSFSEAYLERTFKLTVVGLDLGMGDRQRSFLRCACEDKVHTKDSCWSVRTIYDPRELPGVSTIGP
jgi:hypothetical protein